VEPEAELEAEPAFVSVRVFRYSMPTQFAEVQHTGAQNFLQLLSELADRRPFSLRLGTSGDAFVTDGDELNNAPRSVDVFQRDPLNFSSCLPSWREIYCGCVRFTVADRVVCEVHGHLAHETDTCAICLQNHVRFDSGASSLIRLTAGDTPICATCAYEWILVQRRFQGVVVRRAIDSQDSIVRNLLFMVSNA